MAAGNSPSITGFDPRSVPGMALWLDAADSSTYTPSGGNVSGWRDKVQSITTTPVTGSGASLSNINGLPALYFNAGTNILQASYAQATTNRTFFAVILPTVHSGSYIWPGDTTSSGYSNGFQFAPGSSNNISFADQNKRNIWTSGTNTVTTGSTFIIAITYAGDASTSIYMNGLGPGTTAGSSGTSITSNTKMWIGGINGYASSFLLGEIIDLSLIHI